MFFFGEDLAVWFIIYLGISLGFVFIIVFIFVMDIRKNGFVFLDRIKGFIVPTPVILDNQVFRDVSRIPLKVQEREDERLSLEKHLPDLPSPLEGELENILILAQAKPPNDPPDKSEDLEISKEFIEKEVPRDPLDKEVLRNVVSVVIQDLLAKELSKAVAEGIRTFNTDQEKKKKAKIIKED